MKHRYQYRKRDNQPVVAVPLTLETAGFEYQKWGGRQRCEAGDWIVSNNGDVYTVNRESFERTYRQVGPGTYVKTTPVWAERASVDGQLLTKEGMTHYRAGDYLVFNEESGEDGYAVSSDTFDAMYERTE
jgi:hypothetical protein